MCGIFGVVSLRGAPLRHPDCLAAMARSLAHRGPDGERIVGHERAKIGARRLAIMDLTTGDQPFQSPDGAVWMVCNGEIYNSPALRHEAEGWGYPFRSRGDIENIVPFYERLGPDAVSRLDGMFGLALWDDRRSRLLLARDRAGEKPLFWTRIGDELRFASEVQALLVFPDQPRRVDGEAAARFAALGYVPGPRTMLQGIHKLPPGHLLIAEGGAVTVRAYWSAAEAARAPNRLTSAKQLREVLQAAVRRELMSDVPVGVFTSGGLDSSLLAAAATRVMPGERIHTYAVRFVARGYDESAFAEAVTHDIRTVHHVVTADDDSLRAAFDVVTSRLAEPIGDPAALPTYLLAEAARADVKVVLSGEGADELFGGYPTYLGHRVAELYRRLPRFVRNSLRWLVDSIPASGGKVTLEFMLKQFVAGADHPLAGTASHLVRRPGAQPGSGERRNGSARAISGRSAQPDALARFPDLSPRQSPGEGRSRHHARLDRGARAIPRSRRAGAGRCRRRPTRKVRGLPTKAILQEAARGLVPDRVIARRKRGLSVPIARWLNGGLADLAEPALGAPPAVSGAPTASLLAEHRAGRRNHARKLWPLLIAELWAERWNVEP